MAAEEPRQMIPELNNDAPNVGQSVDEQSSGSNVEARDCFLIPPRMPDRISE
jgi:hypothetical protein